jgi:hypothetical protein
VKGQRRGNAGGKPRLPRFKVPPPGKVHRDRKKDAARAACRRFRKTQTEE